MMALRIFLFISGSILFIWGALVFFNERFYVLWRDLFWQEPNNNHLSKESYSHNRITRGLSAFLLGAVLLGLSVFAQ